MEKIIMLGTGMGITLDLYNTCFVIKNDNGNFLIDTGGSVEIVKRLKQVDININEINHIFISHSHTDHILGLIWIFKTPIIFKKLMNESNININIYCNDVVYESIIAIAKASLPSILVEAILKNVNFHILKNEEEIEINGINYKFFDINAKDTKQFGFECIINGKRLMFLGDETIKPSLYEMVKGADYAMHEAFCLDSEESIFHAYEKNHSTVKSASKIMNELEVKNLILYHTEESHGEKRKELYTPEGKENLNGNIIVPDDFDIIEL